MDVKKSDFIKLLTARNVLVLVFVVLVLELLLLFREKANIGKWSFVGYQYRWSENYVEHDDFESEKECVTFGNGWIEKQTYPKALS